MDDFQKLVGKQVENAFYDGTNIYLQLVDNSVVELNPEGDCCSSCYVQHVSGTQALIGGTIERVDSIESEPTASEKEHADVLDGWGHRFYVTGKGIFDIEMRLAHNGYYGGGMNIRVVDTVPYGAKQLEDF